MHKNISLQSKSNDKSDSMKDILFPRKIKTLIFLLNVGINQQKKVPRENFIFRLLAKRKMKSSPVSIVEREVKRKHIKFLCATLTKKYAKSLKAPMKEEFLSS